MSLADVHLEPMSGTVNQSRDYCKKDGDFHEWGDFTTQGARKDIDAIRELIVKGVPELELAEANIQLYVQYQRGLSKYREAVVRKNTREWRKIQVILLTGPTGTGKTRYASRYAPYIIGGCDLQWWDGYEQEKTILIDEYANDIKLSKLLRITDGSQVRLPIKHGSTYANWTTVFITTNLPELHVQAGFEHREALRRRITTTLRFPLV